MRTRMHWMMASGWHWLRFLPVFFPVKLFDSFRNFFSEASKKSWITINSVGLAFCKRQPLYLSESIFELICSINKFWSIKQWKQENWEWTRYDPHSSNADHNFIQSEATTITANTHLFQKNLCKKSETKFLCRTRWTSVLCNTGHIQCVFQGMYSPSIHWFAPIRLFLL